MDDSLMSAPLPPVVLTVFWCGSGSSKDDPHNQLEVLGQLCSATDISEVTGPLTDFPNPSDDGAVHLKIRFDGCGVAFGLMGWIFGSGLSTQCDQVKAKVNEFVIQQGRQVTLNLYGLSRGAVACTMLCRQLKDFSLQQQQLLSVHVLVFDPVPGNFELTVKIDVFGFSNTWASLDVTGVPAVKRALILFPHENPPANAGIVAGSMAFNPSVPFFDPGVATHEVILGYHHDAMWAGAPHDWLKTWISSVLTLNFLCSHGTRFDAHNVGLRLQTNVTELIPYLDQELGNPTTSTRPTHSRNSIQIIRTTGRPYLNRIHYILRKIAEEHALERYWDWRKPIYFYLTEVPVDVQMNLYLTGEP